jgi:outer membrane lipoprotein-sorting protein
MMYAVFQFLFVSVFLSGASDKIPIVKTEQLVLLKAIDDRYQKAESIQMMVTKKDKLAALEQTREFEGALVLKKGKFRLDVKSKDKNKDESLVVADGKTIWFVTPPPKEFKGAKTQVVKAPMNTDRARAQGLLQMLTQGGVLKYFTVTGATEEEKKITYFLQPDKSSLEFRRAQLVINKEDKTLAMLKYWDSMDNETEYGFSSIEFDKKIDKKLLTYSPPKDADVVNYK